jgi:hypothetical protein
LLNRRLGDVDRAPPLALLLTALPSGGERAQRGSLSADTSGLPCLSRAIVELSAPSLVALPGVALLPRAAAAALPGR